MIINERYFLNVNLGPVPIVALNMGDHSLYEDFRKATKEQFDSVTIWHKNNRKPIVFCDEKIEGLRPYYGKSVEKFKHDIETNLIILNSIIRKRKRKCFRIYRLGGLSLYPEELNEIADAFEFHYGEKLERN